MDSKTKKLLGCGAILIAITVLLVGFGVFSTVSYFNKLNAFLNKEIPEELKEARILKGVEFLKKTEFFKLDEATFTETIGKSLASKDEKERQKLIQSQTAKSYYNFADIKIIGDEIIAVGEFGGFVFDFNGNLKRSILFEPTNDKIKIGWYEQDSYHLSLNDLEIVKLNKDEFGFSSSDSIGGVTVFDKNGNQIWNYGKEKVDLNFLWQDENQNQERWENSKYILEATIGDLDNDGVSEYIVSRKKDGIHAFDNNGNEKWFQPDDFASDKMLVIDLDGDGKNELVELGSKVRNGMDGKLIREMQGDDDQAVLFVEGKDKKKTLQFCGFAENKFVCKDEKDKTLFESAALLSEIKMQRVKINPPKSTPVYDSNNPNVRAEPVDEPSYIGDNSESVYKPRAVLVNFKKDKPKYIAVVASFIGIPRSNFYVYDEKGSLVYHELLPEDAETITVLSVENGTDSILVGGKNTIWKFTSN